jgi:hypothetical protein
VDRLTFQAYDCDTMEMERELGLTYTPAVGSPLNATGRIRYVLDPPGRTGRTGRWFSVTLDTPLTFTVASSAASALTGYASGTRITASSARLTGTTPLSLDAAGRATFRAGSLTLVDGVTIVEPSGVPRTVDVHAAVPWSFTVTVDDTRFTFDRFTDGFGGTFAPR